MCHQYMYVFCRFTQQQKKQPVCRGEIEQPIAILILKATPTNSVHATNCTNSSENFYYAL